MAENNDSVSFDGAVSVKLSEMLAKANARIAALSVVCDVRDAQIKELQDEIEKLKKEAKK